MNEPVDCNCGGKPFIDYSDGGFFGVTCSQCGIATKKYYSSDDAKTAIEKAIDKWNNAMGAYREFEWCTECKEYDQNKHCCHRWTQNIRRTIEEIKRHSDNSENEPLDWDELSMMIGKPVWIEWQQPSRWLLIDEVENRETYSTMYCYGKYGERVLLHREYMNKGWKAYKKERCEND